jgi:hypothetical protein
MKERMRILIGYDGSECADAAIDDLRRAGLPREATPTWDAAHSSQRPLRDR